jgi:HEPN domain-containing protein
MAEKSIARQLLDTARQDLLAATALRGIPGLGEGVVGFHLQQAVEKALKAVLSAAGVAFRRTHDIAELLDLVADNRLPDPPHADWLDELNPYAVSVRYGIAMTPGVDLDRGVEAASEVIGWARSIVGPE